MKTAKIGELRNSLSRFLAYVRRGGRVRVYDRDTPVAEIVPITEPAAAKHETLEELHQRLAREGKMRLGSGGFPPGFFDRPLPKAKRSVVEALLEERREGR